MSILSQLFPFLPFGRYSLTPPSPSDGDLVELQGTVSGALKVALVESAVTTGAGITPNAWSRNQTGADHVVHAGAATLVESWFRNESAGDRWLMFFNLSASPAGRETPVDTFRVPAGGTASIAPVGGWAFGTGITWGVSTTSDPYTAAGATDMYVTVTYRT